MLNSTYTWGTAPNNLTYVRQYGDKDKGAFSVAGLTLSTARTKTVSHQSAANGSTRSMVDFSQSMPIPGSTNGSVAIARAYVVIQRPSFMTETEAKYLVDHVRASLADATFVTAILNRES